MGKAKKLTGNSVRPKRSYRKATKISVSGYRADGSWREESRNLTQEEAATHNRNLKNLADSYQLRPNPNVARSRQHVAFGDHSSDQSFINDDSDSDGEVFTVLDRMIDEVRKEGKRKRKKDAARIALAKNWERIEGGMSSYELQQLEDIAPCECRGHHAVEVKVISFLSESCFVFASGVMRVLIISIELKHKLVRYCLCGQRCAQLISEGIFPSTPIRPKIAFEVGVLELYHLQSVRGPISKTAWAEGLREQLELQGLEIIPNFCTQVR